MADEGTTSAGRPAGGRRRHYRVPAGAGRRLEAVVRPRNESGRRSEWPVTVLDTSAGGAGLEISERASRWLSEGLEIDLCFSLRGHTRTYDVVAEVRRLSDVEADPSRLRLGVSFIDEARFHARLDEEGWRFFNRRAAQRTELGREVPSVLELVARLTGGRGLSLRGGLENLCVAGLAGTFEGHEVEPLLEAERVRVSFSLPGSEHSLRFEVTPRHVTQTGLVQLVGCSFEETGTEDFAERCETVARFLVAHQLRAHTA